MGGWWVANHKLYFFFCFGEYYLFYRHKSFCLLPDFAIAIRMMHVVNTSKHNTNDNHGNVAGEVRSSCDRAVVWSGSSVPCPSHVGLLRR